MSGVRSIMPTSGMIRRSGARIHSVSTNAHRIHFEYGEIGSHDARHANEQREPEERERPGSEDHGNPGRFVESEHRLREQAADQLHE